MKMLSSLASNVEFHIFSRSSRGRDENVVHGVEESLVGEVACSGESLITVWGLLIVNERIIQMYTVSQIKSASNSLIAMIAFVWDVGLRNAACCVGISVGNVD